MNSGMTAEQLNSALAESRQQLLKLATLARVVDDEDYESDRQVSAAAAFWERVKEELPAKRVDRLNREFVQTKADPNEQIDMALRALGLEPDRAPALVRLEPKFWREELTPTRVTILFDEERILTVWADASANPFATLRAAVDRAMLAHTAHGGILNEGVDMLTFAQTLQETEHVEAFV